MNTNIYNKPRFTVGKIISLFVIVFSLVLFSFGAVVISSGTNSVSKITGESSIQAFTGFATSIFKTNREVKTDEDRTNFLAIGVDASGQLADTILVISYHHEEGVFTSINIPRDTTVAGFVKINEQHAYQEQQGVNLGPTYLANTIESEYGVPIHYWAKINFQGIKDLVDSLGGITVNVTTPFSGYYGVADSGGYCVDGPHQLDDGAYCRYTFAAGNQWMDGSTALAYARIRKTDGAEGGDFARSDRQSNIVSAAITTIKTGGNLFKPNKLDSFLRIAGNNLRVSMKSSEVKPFYDLFYKELNSQDVVFKSINWNTSNGFLCDYIDPNSGTYRIIYCDGTIVGDGVYGTSKNLAVDQMQNPLNYVTY